MTSATAGSLTVPGAIVHAVAIGAPFSWIRAEDRERAPQLFAAAQRIAPYWYRTERRERRKRARGHA